MRSSCRVVGLGTAVSWWSGWVVTWSSSVVAAAVVAGRRFDGSGRRALVGTVLVTRHR
ncbi:hypothetical protein [Kitasatospora sp. NPDC001175]|uniref:hypothetical protein n=1 Tax=Kitasatospora sp. NPDC001175 TaxID=3157103 RepID=UPI003CFC093A